jgi:hypothetical protein
MKLQLRNTSSGANITTPLGGLTPLASEIYEILPAAYLAIKTTLDGTANLAYSIFEADVKEFGARGDATTDDTTAIQLAMDTVSAAGGGTLHFPLGKYRVTAQLVVGTKFVSESEVTVLTPDYTALASYNASNRTAALAAGVVNLIGEPGAIIWGNYAPGSESAIICYAACTKSDTRPVIAPVVSNLLLIGSPGMALGGAILTPSTGTAPATNVSGIFAAGTRIVLQDVMCRTVKRGIILCSTYWSSLCACEVWHCDYGIVYPGANASGTRDCVVSYAASVGYSYEGQEFKVSGAHTEECAVSCYIPSADSFAVDDCYWEAVGVALTDYQLKLGDGTNSVLWGSFRNIHLSSTHGKTAYLQKAQVDFYSSRFYDFGVDGDRMRVDNSSVVSSFRSNVPTYSGSTALTNVQEQSWRGPSSFTFSATGAIASGATTSQAFAVTAGGELTTKCDVHAEFQGALPAGCLSWAQVTSTNNVTVTILNASGAPISFSAMNCDIFWRQVQSLAAI